MTKKPVRLWKLGSLEHKVLPTQSSVDKLRNILKKHIGDDDTVNIIWGPELDLVSIDCDHEVEQIFDYDSLPMKIEQLERKLKIYKTLYAKHMESKNENSGTD